MTTVPRSGEPALNGSLSPESLVCLLRTLYVGRHTGVLSMSRSGERLVLRFVCGRIVSGSDGPVGRLGDILVRLGQVPARDLEQALEKAALEGVRLGPVLVAERMATHEQVQEALRLQVRDVLFAAFFWGFGAYRFEADEGPADQEDINLELSTTSLIFEVASCLESPGVVLSSLGALDGPVLAAPDAAERLRRDRARLSPADGYVLSRAEGITPVRQIVESASLPTEAVERSLVALVCCDAVRSSSMRKPLPAPDETIAIPRAMLRVDGPDPDETIALPRASVGLDALVEKRHHAELVLRAMEKQGHFAVLGLSEGAPAEEVKRAYLRLARRYHPDAARDRELARLHSEIFLRVSEACNVLGSSDSRERYERHPADGPDRPSPEARSVPAARPARATEAVPLPEPAEAVREAAELMAAGRPFESATLLGEILPHTKGRLRTQARLMRARAFLKTPSGSHIAEREVRELLDDEPECVEACILLGDIYGEHGLARRAQAQYLRVLELEPENSIAAARLPAVSPRRSIGRLAVGASRR